MHFCKHKSRPVVSRCILLCPHIGQNGFINVWAPILEREMASFCLCHHDVLFKSSIVSMIKIIMSYMPFSIYIGKIGKRPLHFLQQNVVSGFKMFANAFTFLKSLHSGCKIKLIPKSFKFLVIFQICLEIKCCQLLGQEAYLFL